MAVQNRGLRFSRETKPRESGETWMKAFGFPTALCVCSRPRNLPQLHKLTLTLYILLAVTPGLSLTSAGSLLHSPPSTKYHIITAMTKRPLIKGPLRAPLCQPCTDSYTQAPTSKDEVKFSTKRTNVPGMYFKSQSSISVISIILLTSIVVEITHEAFAQPFLNPSIIQERIKDDQQWRVAQEKLKEQEAASSSSQGR